MRLGSSANISGPSGEVSMRKDWPATSNQKPAVFSFTAIHAINIPLTRSFLLSDSRERSMRRFADVTIHQEAGALVEFGPINALDFFLGDIAFSQEIATPKIERRKERP